LSGFQAEQLEMKGFSPKNFFPLSGFRLDNALVSRTIRQSMERTPLENLFPVLTLGAMKVLETKSPRRDRPHAGAFSLHIRRAIYFGFQSCEASFACLVSVIRGCQFPSAISTPCTRGQSVFRKKVARLSDRTRMNREHVKNHNGFFQK